MNKTVWAVLLPFLAGIAATACGILALVIQRNIGMGTALLVGGTLVVSLCFVLLFLRGLSTDEGAFSRCYKWVWVPMILLGGACGILAYFILYAVRSRNI